MTQAVVGETVAVVGETVADEAVAVRLRRLSDPVCRYTLLAGATGRDGPQGPVDAPVSCW